MDGEFGLLQTLGANEGKRMVGARTPIPDIRPMIAAHIPAIVSESFVRAFGFREDPTGQQRLPGEDFPNAFERSRGTQAGAQTVLWESAGLPSFCVSGLFP